MIENEYWNNSDLSPDKMSLSEHCTQILSQYFVENCFEVRIKTQVFLRELSSIR